MPFVFLEKDKNYFSSISLRFLSFFSMNTSRYFTSLIGTLNPSFERFSRIEIESVPIKKAYMNPSTISGKWNVWSKNLAMKSNTMYTPNFNAHFKNLNDETLFCITATANPVIKSTKYNTRIPFNITISQPPTT